MKLVKISRNNVKRAVDVARLCFDKQYVKKEVVFWYNARLDGSYKETNDVIEYFVVVEKNRPIAITGFYKLKNDKIFWLGYFGVIPNKRKTGRGSAILGQTLQKARRMNCHVFGAWTTSKRAGKFYEKNGFKKGKSPKKIIVDGKLVYTYPKNSIFYYKKI